MNAAVSDSGAPTRGSEQVLTIRGGRPLVGRVEVKGAKNLATKAMVASLLGETVSTLRDVPEISEHCWDMLGVSPAAMMCASSRMVVKAKGDDRPHVVACTLLPYDPRFALGEALSQTLGAVPLNHPHCARFCVLGGASCSG